MKFQTSSATALAVAALAGTTIAAPTVKSPSNLRRDTPIGTIYPINTSQYTVSTGAVASGVSEGLISKSTDDHGADITTLLTFFIDPYWSGHTCEFSFDLAPTDTASGSAEADLFTSIAPVTGSASSWPSGNLRDNYVGRFSVAAGATATWEQANYGANARFSCGDAAGMYYGGELVGVGDNDVISWTVWEAGPKVLVYA